MKNMTAPPFVERVIKNCLRINKDDRVCIFTWRHTIDLAEALAIECEKLGAQVGIDLTTDDLWYDHVFNSQIDALETPNSFELALDGVATATIFIAGPENPARLKKGSAERWIAYSRAGRQSYQRLLERKVRIAGISLGQVTPQRAKTYGFDYREWRKNVEDAIDVEYEKMRELGEKVSDILQKSHEVKITNPDGTNLSFSLGGRKAYVNDGVIDDEDIKIGSNYASLPGGTVEIAATETSANGVLSSKCPYANSGALIKGIILRFEKGKLVSFEGDKSIDLLRGVWKKATGDKDKIGWLSIGLNPKARTGFINNQIVLGTATIGIGSNKGLDGENETDYASEVTVVEPTVKFDNTTIIKQGKLAF
jgi:leucyl aminopeptidase (aminopeptidase T)